MQFSLVNNVRVEAFSCGRGVCPVCQAEMIAKCGSRMIAHWAHAKCKNCDPWWENETLWHRHWKNRFPPECREITHMAANGEIHRADIKTPTGIIIEVQHSNITDLERISREEFYKNLIWIIDGAPFKKNFDIYHLLPDPQSEIAKDIVWVKAKRHQHGANNGIFFKLSELRENNPFATKSMVSWGQYHFMHEIADQVHQSYSGHHQFDWIRPRKAWLESSVPVFIDFGDEYLVKFEVYDEYELSSIRLVSKLTFIYDSMIETNALKVGSHF